MSSVVGVGSGGHAKVVIDILRNVGGWDIVALLDSDKNLWKTLLMGIPIVGDDGLLPSILGQGTKYAFVGVGGSGDLTPRVALFNKLIGYGFSAISAIHPSAIVAKSAELGSGVTVAANAVINPEAKIGSNVIVNTGSIIEHDCIIGDHCHISTGSRVCGSVNVGIQSHIGAGATVRQGITIGAGAIVGAGAVVVKDVPPETVVVGIPAQPLKRL